MCWGAYKRKNILQYCDECGGLKKLRKKITSMERSPTKDLTVLEQCWLFKSDWRLKMGKYYVVIPFGKSYFLKPLSSKRVLLPWLVTDCQFQILDSCDVPHVLSLYRYSAKLGGVSMLLFNALEHEALVSAKTGAIIIKSKSDSVINLFVPNKKEIRRAVQCHEINLNIIDERIAKFLRCLE